MLCTFWRDQLLELLREWRNVVKVLFVGKIDPWCSTPCGIRGYFQGLIKPYFKNGIEVTLMGISPSSSHECLRIGNSVTAEQHRPPLLRRFLNLLHQFLNFEFNRVVGGAQTTESLEERGGGKIMLSSFRGSFGLVPPSTRYDNIDVNQFSFVNVYHHKMYSRSQALFIATLNIKSLLLKIKGFYSDFDLIHVQRIDQAIPFVFLKKSVICTLHGKGSEQALDKYGKLIYLIYTAVERFALSKVDYAIAVSDDICKFYVSKYPWSSNKILVIGNGVDTSVFKPRNKDNVRQKYGFSSHEKIILYLGRFHEEKNLKLLISAFDRLSGSSNLKNLRLVLVGEGNTGKQISNMVKERNLTKRVTFLPPVLDSEVPEIICCADVFALTSVVEGFPLVILQALACGVPVVSTNVGDVHRVVKNYETGFLVNDFSDKTFAECLEKAFLNIINLRENATKVAKKNSWEFVANENINLYNKVLKVSSK